MKRIILALATVLTVGVISAPAQAPQFPQTLPANSVVGRLGIGPGPSQAIPFANLSAALLANPVVTAHAVVLGGGASAFGAAPIGTSGRLLIDQGAGVDPGFKVMSGDATLAANGAIAVASNAVTNAKAAQMATNTLKGNNTASTANSQDLTTSQVIAMLGLSGRNIAARFGSMDVWQRGAGGAASFSVSASTTNYTVDGCYIKTGANEAFTVAAASGIAAGSLKSAGITRNAAQTGTTSVIFGCPLDTDELTMMLGSYVTLSFTASTGANWSPTSGNLTYELFCGTGSIVKQSTGYTGQTTPINTTVAIAAGTAAARYQSTSQAIIPTNCSQAEIQFNWLPVGTAGAADTVTIDDIQLEIVVGPTSLASNFLKLDFADQLRKAQRHYAKTFPYGTAPAQSAGVAGAFGLVSSGTNNCGAYYTFPQQMRINPTVTTYNPVSAATSWRDFDAGADRTVGVDPASALGPGGVNIRASSCVANNTLSIHVSADAGI